MQNDARMTAFEAVYAGVVDSTPEAVKALRFDKADSYAAPRTAHAYRVYCATLDQVAATFPTRHEKSVQDLLDLMQSVKNGE